MKIEERLHDALHEYADTIEPEEGSWARISARFDEGPAPRRPRSHARVLVFAALAVVTIVVIGAALLRDTGSDGGTKRVATIPRGSATPLPQQVLAVTDGGAPTILDSTTGARSFSYGAAPIAEGTQIAVSPDQQTAYMVAGDGDKGCVDHSVLQLQIGSGSGSSVVATSATDPAVSPDGRYLAYLHCSPGAGNQPNHIVLRDRVTGAETETTAPQGTFFISRVEFVPDAHRVVFNLFDEATGRATVHELNVVDGEEPPGLEVGAAAGASVWVGVRGQTGEFLSVTGSPPSVLSTTGFDRKGATDPLFTLPDVPTQVVSDESGRHILAVADHALYRWSVGEKHATKVADGVIGAAWIPDPPQAPPVAPASVAPPAALPAGVVVARNGELDVLGASDGDQHSSLGAFPNLTGLSALPDGRDLVYASSTGPSPDCNGNPFPKVQRLDTTKVEATPAAASTFVVGGSDSPAVSPDGEWVAYGIKCDGITPGYTNLKTGANYRFDALPNDQAGRYADIASTEPLAWSPSSQQVVYRVVFNGDPSAHYYLATLSPPAGPGQAAVVEPVGSGITAAAFLDDGVLVLANASGTETTVRTFALAGGGTKTMFVLPGKVVSLVADPSGRHLLALRDDGALYRWSQGDHEPVKVSDGVTAAAWVPWS